MTTPANTPGIFPLNPADRPLTLDSAFALPPGMEKTAHALVRPAKLTREKNEPFTPYTFFSDKITDKHLSLWEQITSSFHGKLSRHSSNCASESTTLADDEAAASSAPLKSPSRFASSSLGKAENKSLRFMSGIESADARETQSKRSPRG